MKIFHLFTKILDFITKYLKVFIFLLVVGLIFAPKDDLPKQDANVARINLYGTILQSDTFLEELEKIEQNPKIQGILLVIDSPGPSFSASSLMSAPLMMTPIEPKSAPRFATIESAQTPAK